MKKIAVLILVVLASGILMISCKSSAKCAAYGETQKFQRETKY